MVLFGVEWVQGHGRDLDDARLVAVLEQLGLGERFADLDSLILADSRGISTGERVRLIVGRALLAGASLLVIDDIAGVLDVDSRVLVRTTLESQPGLCIVEATVDTPVLDAFTERIDVSA